MTSSAQYISRPAPARVASEAAARPRERAFRSLVRTIGLLDRAILPHFARFGISRSQWAMLRTLHHAESPGQNGLRVTELSDRLLIRPPSVTGVLDRLVRSGLVTRVAAVDDLRAKCVRLTVKGRRLVEEVSLVHGQQIDRLLAGLSSPDCDELYRLVDRLSEHLESLLRGPA
jgi:MarR family transcriptional repressor of emrRAB